MKDQRINIGNIELQIREYKNDADEISLLGWQPLPSQPKAQEKNQVWYYASLRNCIEIPKRGD